MTHYVMLGLEFGPVIIERALRQIDERTMGKPTGEGRFSPREVAAHLADWEPILMGRIRQTVERPGSTLATYDEGQMSIDGNYAGSDPFEMAQAFAKHRKATAEYLRGLQPEDWNKRALHPERGEMSVKDWASALVGHDMYHIEQLTSVW